MSRLLPVLAVWGVVVGSTVGLVGSPEPAFAQTPRSVYVTVVDDDGKAVPGLTAADFRLRENNRDQVLTSVEPAADMMQVAIMVEETLTPAGAVRQGIFELIKQLQGKAEMSLVVVGLSNRTAVPYTTDINALVAGINELPLSQRQQTNHVPEGIGDMARAFQKERPTRPVMVMIALDSQQTSAENPQAVLNALRDSNAQLHVVSIETSRAAVDINGAGSLMDAAARGQVLGDGPRQSGGKQWPITVLTAVPGAMLAIANDLLGQYKLSYTLPEGTRPSDRLNVSLSRRGLTLRAPTRIWNGQ